MERKSFGIGLLLGAAIGAGTALLLAPASGDDTRRVLSKKARRFANRGSERAEELWEDADRSAREFTRHGMKRGRQAADRARNMIGR